MGNSPIYEISSNNPKPKEEVLIGLMNVNNTCYINSIIQSLYSIKSFKDQIRLIPNNIEKNTTLGGLNKLFTNILKEKKNNINEKKNNEKTHVLDINFFVQIIKMNNNDFNNDDHHDAHEFLIWLLDNLEQNYKKENIKNKNSNQTNIITDLFSGKQVSQTKCLNCEKVRNNYNKFKNKFFNF